MSETALKRRPFLRWAGSKRQLVPVLSKYWTGEHRRYIEPFAGLACLFFNIQPKDSILGDINAELIATYEQVKYDMQSLLYSLSKLKKSREEYYRLRAIKPNTLSPSNRAARFIYLNRFCFNGLYRTNRNGKFNVPYGGERAGGLPTSETFHACNEILQNTSLIPDDFGIVLEEARAGDFVYIDPPFSVKERRVFNEYDASTFTQNDLRRLKMWLDKLNNRSVEFLVSYADCEEAALLKEGYHAEMVTVKRNIAGFASRRCMSNEVLISNKMCLMN